MPPGMTLREAYEYVQRRKDEANQEWPPSMAPVLRQVAEQVRRQLKTDDPTVIAMTVGGMAWVAHMLHEEDVDVAEAMDVPLELSVNMTTNLPAEVLDGFSNRQSVELGIGAGFYTGLWVGLLMRDAV